MPIKRFSSLRNATNGVLVGKIAKNFFWRGYYNGVQLLLSEIPGSASDLLNLIYSKLPYYMKFSRYVLHEFRDFKNKSRILSDAKSKCREHNMTRKLSDTLSK